MLHRGLPTVDLFTSAAELSADDLAALVTGPSLLLPPSEPSSHPPRRGRHGRDRRPPLLKLFRPRSHSRTSQHSPTRSPSSHHREAQYVLCPLSSSLLTPALAAPRLVPLLRPLLLLRPFPRFNWLDPLVHLVDFAPPKPLSPRSAPRNLGPPPLPPHYRSLSHSTRPIPRGGGTPTRARRGPAGGQGRVGKQFGRPNARREWRKTGSPPPGAMGTTPERRTDERGREPTRYVPLTLFERALMLD